MTTREELRAIADGLICPEVGSWAETKYRLVSLYDDLFSTGMKDKWRTRVYIDLYAGAGHCRVQGTSTVLKGSPVLALSVKHPFDKYIFCEEDPELLRALRTRAERTAPNADISYVLGDCDIEIDRICAEIPQPSKGNTVLCLCFVDPFDFGINFGTLCKLSFFFMDFLVLLAVGMDANRNYDRYVEGESTKIDQALGNVDWRKRWEQLGRRKEFRSFLASEFAKSMEKLEYLLQTVPDMRLVRSTEKNLPLYYLALFSRNHRAYKFWKEVLKYGTDQRDLFTE
jgi:three-Cys-motif partner protein